LKKILLAYSGGLDTSCLLAWLKDTYDCPVVAYVADVGQNEDLAAVRKKAAATGAETCIVDDLREEFARDYVFSTVMANGVYEGAYLMGTALARPVIAKGMVRAALAQGADAVAHGSTGKGNDQVRFELTTKALAPQLAILAPWRTWEFAGRQDLIAYAKKKGIPVSQTAEKPYSMDANLMHISYEGGILEDPAAEPPADMFTWTTAPERAPDKPEVVEVAFESGVPVAVNGERLSPAPLVARLNDLGARHGVGRVDVVENRYVGIKSRGVYETPGVTILLQAHRAVESLALDREVAHLKESLVPKFAELVYYGYWFSPEMEALQAFLRKTQEPVTGSARIKLFKGSASVVGRSSPNSLYNPAQSSFEGAVDFQPSDSTGFININGLRLISWSRRHGRLAKGL
jgi:argininosuccinate synthase